MRLKPALAGALALLMAAPITVSALDQAAAAMMLGRSLKASGESLSVEEHRLATEAERIAARLTEISVDDLDTQIGTDGRSAVGRFGELLAASRGLTMRWVGPVAHTFRVDRSAVSVIMGPYGSAKTTTCFQKIINSIIWQPAGPDGVRRARWCVVRDTWGHLQSNVMADWFLWFPKTKANYNLSTNTHRLTFDIPLAGGEVMKLELEMLFRATDNQSAEELFKGMALTGLWLNEMDTLHKDVFNFGFPRVGRFRAPGTPVGGWSGLIGDMNAPAEDNWTYDFCVNKNWGLTQQQLAAFKQEFGASFDIKFHVQPGGLSAGAENLANLPKGYYQRAMIGMTEADQRRFIHNQFGAVRDGNPVYSQYNDARHCVQDMPADPALPVHLAVDGGATPACVFGQKTASNQIRVVDECVIYEPGTEKVLASLGAKEFGQMVGHYWNENFAGFELGKENWGDPSAWFDDNQANAEDRAWIVRFVSGFNETAIGVTLKMKPAPVKRNLIGTRLEAVRDLLKAANDNQPAYVISSKCKVLREGYNRGYVIVRVPFSTGGGRWKDEPLKNDFSHVHDANQYLVLGLTKFTDWEDARDRSASRRHAGRRPEVKFGDGAFAHRPPAPARKRAANDNWQVIGRTGTDG